VNGDDARLQPLGASESPTGDVAVSTLFNFILHFEGLDRPAARESLVWTSEEAVVKPLVCVESHCRLCRRSKFKQIEHSAFAALLS
jgi:hypothetical protein